MSDFEAIENAMNVDTSIVENEGGCVKRSDKALEVAQDTKKQLRKDYDYTRGNLYSLIEKGQEAVDGILELAQESDQPRAYEVADNLSNTSVTLLINLQTFIKKLMR